MYFIFPARQLVLSHCLPFSRVSPKSVALWLQSLGLLIVVIFTFADLEFFWGCWFLAAFIGKLLQELLRSSSSSWSLSICQ